MDDGWLVERVRYLQGLRKLGVQQQLLVALASLPSRSPVEERKLAALVRAEKASERALKARKEAADFIYAEKRAAEVALRKARNHALFTAAGWLVQAGLLEKVSGAPLKDPVALLGAFLSLANEKDRSQWQQWRKVGEEFLAQGVEGC